jgi:hypothetical protein
MKKLIMTVLVLMFTITYTWAQKTKSYQQDPAKMTQEQRMVQSNAKKKNGGRNADVSKKVKRAKKQDRAARRMKAPKSNKQKR